MKIDEAVKLMTKQYLNRVLESFTHDFGPMNEGEIREFIVENSEKLSKPSRVTRKLDFFDVSHSRRVLMHFVVEALVNAGDCFLTERELAEAINLRETQLIEEAERDDAFTYANQEAIETLRTVLVVAFDDDEISRDEYQLIRKLREHLTVSRKQQRLIEAQLNVFPTINGEPHTFEDVRQAVKNLEKRGILFYCNQAEEGPCIVLPDEMKKPVKEALGIEMSDLAREKLWSSLSNANLQEILRSESMAVSGTKKELVVRLLRAEITPSIGLNYLMSDDLYEICSSLPGVHVSGSKEERTERIVHYFDNLVSHESEDEDDPAATAYAYYAELARRDRQVLLANDIIKKDLHIEHMFEAATTYLFNDKLGVETGDFTGSDHADGLARFKDGSLFLWDNKSKESVYDFPPSHQRQFKRYIRDSEERVSCFMVIVPEIDSERTEPGCLQVKYDSHTDTDVCVITAEDLKWVAEHWEDYSKRNGTFDLNVFNQTGILTKLRLEQAMKLLL